MKLHIYKTGKVLTLALITMLIVSATGCGYLLNQQLGLGSEGDGRIKIEEKATKENGNVCKINWESDGTFYRYDIYVGNDKSASSMTKVDTVYVNEWTVKDMPYKENSMYVAVVPQTGSYSGYNTVDSDDTMWIKVKSAVEFEKQPEVYNYSSNFIDVRFHAVNYIDYDFNLYKYYYGSSSVALDEGSYVHFNEKVTNGTGTYNHTYRKASQTLTSGYYVLRQSCGSFYIDSDYKKFY